MKEKAKKRNNGTNNVLMCVFIVIFSLSLILVVCQAYGDEAKSAETRMSNYDIEGTPDPFKPVIQPIMIKKAKTTVKEAKSVPLTPLELFSIGQLKLVGITMGQGKNMAMIEDPTGKFYLITKGTLIGLKKGKVADIHPDRVVIEEKTIDSDEKKKVSRIVLELFSETRGE
ncbi:MAG: pilus assembly protein PilP [Deltaproteobacteria bacterium]|nr:pilus assembly protein PilP [Deltaproteobacteria bacterium]